MGKIAVLTDSNSGITQEQAKELGVYVIPMPFFIDGQQYFEGINLTQEEFYEKLKNDADISTSQPSVGELQDEWDKLLKEYDEIVFIPMSSGLSGTCQTAVMLSDDYDGKGSGCQQPAHFRNHAPVCVRCKVTGIQGLFCGTD